MPKICTRDGSRSFPRFRNTLPRRPEITGVWKLPKQVPLTPSSALIRTLHLGVPCLCGMLVSCHQKSALVEKLVSQGGASTPPLRRPLHPSLFPFPRSSTCPPIALGAISGRAGSVQALQVSQLGSRYCVPFFVATDGAGARRPCMNTQRQFKACFRIKCLLLWISTEV